MALKELGNDLEGGGIDIKLELRSGRHCSKSSVVDDWGSNKILFEVDARGVADLNYNMD